MNTLGISLKRHQIIISDLTWAQKFAEHILKKNLHKKGGEQAELIHRALNLSMVISYCRPFGRNEEGKPKETADSPLYGLVKSFLTKDEFDLHKRIVKARHNIYAHSAASAHQIVASKNKSVVMHKDVLKPMTIEDTTMLYEMIKKWIDYLKQRRSEIV